MVQCIVDVGERTGFPKYPPVGRRVLLVPEQYATPARALAAARPGDHVSLGDGTYAGDVTVSASGSAAGFVVIRARNHGKAILTGHWNVVGTYVWLTGLTMRRPGTNPSRIKGGKNDNYTSNLVDGTNPNYSVRLGGSFGRVTNCRIESPNGICAPTSAHNISICWNDFCCRTKPIWSQANGIYLGAFGPTSRGSDNVLIARNKWYNDLAVTNWVTANPADDSDVRHCVYTGNNEPRDNKTGNNRSVRFIENFVDVTTVPTGWYFKRGYEVGRNFIRAKNVAFNQRHGGYSDSDGVTFGDLTDDKRAYIWGNNFDRGIFRLNDTDHLVVSNRMGGTTELYYGGRRTTGSSATKYSIANIPPGFTQAASRVIFVGNTFVGDIRAGEDEGTSTKPWKVWGAAEQRRWGAREPTQGDRIEGVKNYGANVPNQPNDANGRFVRLTNRYGEQTVASGAAGYQLLSGDGGYAALLTTHVARADLEFATGCDAIS